MVTSLEKRSKLQSATARVSWNIWTGTWLQEAIEVELPMRLACRQRTFISSPVDLGGTWRNVAEVGEVEVIRRCAQRKAKETVAASWGVHHR
jgi:hypothetical protein